MKQNIINNRAWFLTGFETVLLGVFFLFIPDVLSTKYFSNLFNWLDDTLPAIFLIVVGTFTVINSAFEVEPNWHQANVFLLEFIWVFYTTTFIIRDFQIKNSPYVSLTSILCLSVAARIFFESWLGDRNNVGRIKNGNGSK